MIKAITRDIRKKNSRSSIDKIAEHVWQQSSKENKDPALTSVDIPVTGTLVWIPVLMSNAS